jgi:hypothetical protein
MWTGVAGDNFRVADDGPLPGRAAVGPRQAPRPPPERSLEGLGSWLQSVKDARNVQGADSRFPPTAPGFPEAPFLERMGSRFSQEVRERVVRMVWEH